MRRSAADYLEEMKLEELTAYLEGKGYRVEREAPLGDQRVDLLAERGDERLAFAVKARSRLEDSSQELVRLRKAALDARLTGFRIVVAVPPRTVDVSIDNLRAELLAYLIEHRAVVEHETPETVQPFADVTKFVDVIDLLIDVVEIHPSRVHVHGRAWVDVEAPIDDKWKDQYDFAVDIFPFTFDLDLDHDLKIARMNRLVIETEGAKSRAAAHPS